MYHQVHHHIIPHSITPKPLHIALCPTYVTHSSRHVPCHTTLSHVRCHSQQPHAPSPNLHKCHFLKTPSPLTLTTLKYPNTPIFSQEPPHATHTPKHSHFHFPLIIVTPCDQLLHSAWRSHKKFLLLPHPHLLLKCNITLYQIFSVYNYH